MKKLYGNWFDSKHPYYLNDMMRNVLPKLDSDMQKLENETIVVPIPKAKKPIVQPKQPAGNNNINDKNANNNKNGAGKNIIALPITGSDILSLGTIALILLVSGALIVSNKSKNKI